MGLLPTHMTLAVDLHPSEAPWPVLVTTGANLDKDEDNVHNATLHPPSLPNKNGEEVDLEELISIPDTEESTSASFPMYLTFEGM